MIEDQLISTGLSFLSGLGSPDDSKNWDYEKWGWYIHTKDDPNMNPMRNFLPWLAKNPSFISPGLEGHDADQVMARVSAAGYGSQIKQIYDSFTWNDGFAFSNGSSVSLSSMNTPANKSNVIGGLSNLFGGNSSPFQNYLPQPQQQNNSSFIWIVLAVVAFLLFGKKLFK